MAVISSILDEFRRGKKHIGVLDGVEYERKVEISWMRPCLAVQPVSTARCSLGCFKFQIWRCWSDIGL